MNEKCFVFIKCSVSSITRNSIELLKKGSSLNFVSQFQFSHYIEAETCGMRYNDFLNVLRDPS